MPLRNRLAAEFVGTFWLVFGGCGSAVLAAPLVGGALAGFLFPLVAGESVEAIAEGRAMPRVA